MSSFKLLFKLIKPTAIVCGGCVVFSLLLVASVTVWSMKVDAKLGALSESHRQLGSESEAAQLRAQTIEKTKGFYEQAMRSGLIGPARREDWVQSLLNAHKALGLQGVPGFRLDRPEKINPGSGADPAVGGASAMAPMANSMPAAPAEVYAHNLEFKLTDVNEVEVLSILARLQDEHPGIQRSVGCKLKEPKPSGLTAECMVRFFNIADPSQSVAPHSPS